MHRIFNFSAVALAALVGLSAALPGDAADAKKKKRKGPPATGVYRGVVSERGSSVTFTLGRDGSLVGFTATGFNIDCYTNVPNSTDGVMPGNPSGTRTATVTPGPLSIGAIGRTLPNRRSFVFDDPAAGPTKGVHIKGLTRTYHPKAFGLLGNTAGPGFSGSLNVDSATGPRDAVGTEICESGPLQWAAARNWRPG